MSAFYLTTAEAAARGLPSVAEQILRHNRSLTSVACEDCGAATAPHYVTGEHRCTACINDLRFHD